MRRPRARSSTASRPTSAHRVARQPLHERRGDTLGRNARHAQRVEAEYARQRAAIFRRSPQDVGASDSSLVVSQRMASEVVIEGVLAAVEARGRICRLDAHGGI